MTSEICVANRRALVLAADSAVTVTRWENGQKEERYFKGANKIFQLSAYQPVGVMIFDTADLHRVPWEIIVKDFRSHLGRKTCGGLSSYAESFFSYIEASTTLFTKKMRDEIFVEAVDQTVIKLLRSFEAESDVKDAPDPATAQAARQSKIDVWIDASKIWVPMVGISFDELAVKTKENMVALHCEAKADLAVLAPGSNYDIDVLIEVASKWVIAFPQQALSCTGLVIAGYGDDDIFPSYISYDCSGLLVDKLLREEKDSYTVDRRTTGHINAFATKAMVDTFKMGFGPDVLEQVTSSLKNVLQTFAGKVCSASSQNLPNLDALIVEAVADHQAKWTAEVIKGHTYPFQRVIGSLPIDEMVGLAETLVMLESLKEKVTQPSESVGGPIDVAIITKNEGFVWAKRKHFFDRSINPRFAFRQQEAYHSQSKEKPDVGQP